MMRTLQLLFMTVIGACVLLESHGQQRVAQH